MSYFIYKYYVIQITLGQSNAVSNVLRSWEVIPLRPFPSVRSFSTFQMLLGPSSRSLERVTKYGYNIPWAKIPKYDLVIEYSYRPIHFFSVIVTAWRSFWHIELKLLFFIVKHNIFFVTITITITIIIIIVITISITITIIIIIIIILTHHHGYDFLCFYLFNY